MKEDNMMYLILKETSFDTIDSIYDICNFTTDINKANDMLQGYRLVEKAKNVSYSMLRYEQPLKLTKEMEC
jgi:flagellar basal body P-ring protein FlgI